MRKYKFFVCSWLIICIAILLCIIDKNIVLSISNTNQITTETAVNLIHEIVENGNYKLLDQLLSKEQLKNATLSQLRLIRNTIYAKYGYTFKQKELQEHFSKFDWYSPKFNNVNNQLTPIDKSNLDLIIKLENDYKNNEYISWTKNLDMASYQYNGIAYGNNKFVVIGNDGIIKTSEDGVSWKLAKSGTVQTLSSIIWDGKQFIAVGSEGTIISSPDGYNWSARMSGTKEWLTGIAYNGSLYVIVGSNKIKLRSNDGVKWYQKRCGSNLNKVASNGNIFVGVGGDPNEASIEITNDGVNWKILSFLELPFKGVAWGQGRFIAMNEDTILVSTDGLNWSQSCVMQDQMFCNVICSGKDFFLLGENILKSNNGKTWFELYSKSKYILSDMVWDGNKYIAVGNGIIVVSTDGLSWKIVEDKKSYDFRKIHFNGKQYLLINWLDDETSILTSLDGVKWDNKGIKLKGLIRNIFWDGEKYIIIGPKGIETSKNGIDWKAVNYEANLESGTWNTQNCYIAVGNSILISQNGSQWSKLSWKPREDLNDIIWNGKEFLAVGREGYIITSKDGKHWSEQNPGTNKYLENVIWDGKKYIVIGWEGTILTSINGRVWQKINLDIPHDLLDITWNGTWYVIVGGTINAGDGVILTSRDGVNWDAIESVTSNKLEDIIWDGDKFIIVGENGTILYGN